MIKGLASKIIPMLTNGREREREILIWWEQSQERNFNIEIYFYALQVERAWSAKRPEV